MYHLKGEIRTLRFYSFISKDFTQLKTLIGRKEPLRKLTSMYDKTLKNGVPKLMKKRSLKRITEKDHINC